MRRFSRPERLVRRLRLATFDDENERGLILVQIDGLARKQLEHALQRGRMPFLKQLLSREHYRLHSVYSGLPSTTPAVQGEFFYGVPQCVPAFGFRDHESKAVVRMIEPETAARVERRLTANCELPLLAGGSSYSNVFTGGAAEPHFCPAAIGDEKTTWTTQPGVRARLFLWHLPSLVRMVFAAVGELAVACTDMLRGVIAGRDFKGELHFVPKRVAISVMLRDLITIGACVDAARGLPVIQLNYLGYDEQAHRRGPGSLFAQWSLLGIDAAIKRIWHAAHTSSRREYDLWVYSDHGQQRSMPFTIEHGRTYVDAINAVLTRELGIVVTEAEQRSIISGERAQWLRGKAAQSHDNNVDMHGNAGRDEPRVVGMGPLGYIYLPQPLAIKEQDRIARLLVAEAKIPLVLVRGESGSALAWNADGRFTLPDEAAAVLGDEHPFLSAAADDLAKVCHHPDAGDFVISAFSRDGKPLSFPMERGAHGGPGEEESGAFALVPKNAPLVKRDNAEVLRPVDLREAALAALGRAQPAKTRDATWRRTSGSLRLMTYNVHRCVGVDGRLSPERIARVIAQCDADVVALQELDVMRRRTAGVDQARRIAELLQMEFHFHPAITLEEEQYGDAILSRLPLKFVRAGALPASPSDRRAEPRGALWVEINAGGQAVQVINTHLGLGRRERLGQIDALLGSDWLGHPDCSEPAILCGDFNAPVRSEAYRRLVRRVRDAQTVVPGHRRRGTWISDYPLLSIDHIFFKGKVDVASAEVVGSTTARLASDHLPLVVDFTLPLADASDGELGPVTAHHAL